MRANNRANTDLRDIKITRNYLKHPEGSVLIEVGATKVICTASVVPGVPRWLKGKNQGWLTAEYNMLPRATHERVPRDVTRGSGPSGRTHEIQRLIGRALRSAVDLTMLGENTLTIDCDVIQADGGTRTASITGACVAMHDAITFMQRKKLINKDPFKYFIAAVSVGIQNAEPIIDLDYSEDSNAATDMNIVMTEHGDFIEVQGTAEGKPFNYQQLQAMLELAKNKILEIFTLQKNSLSLL